LAARGDATLAASAQRSLDLSETLRTARGRMAAVAAPAAPPVGAPPAVAPPAGPKQQLFDCAGTRQQPTTPLRTDADPPVADPAVNQAFDNTVTTWKFYQQVFGRNSLDGNGKLLVSLVHYGQNYMNAMWQGEHMLYGDGDGMKLQHFTGALEVIAHELTHGVTDASAQLVYEGQTGALNESFSDVLGSLCKQWSLGQTADQADWLIGASVLGPGFVGRALRDMEHPGTAFNDPLIGPDPQTANMSDYKTMQVDHGGTHINSGIANRAFVLAAKAIGGKAWEVAGQVWYVTLTTKLGPNSDFRACALATLDVAKVLFAADASVAGKIATGWLTVGVLQRADVTAAGVQPV
jgi:Zn-dependent metalloprotease